MRRFASLLSCAAMVAGCAGEPTAEIPEHAEERPTVVEEARTQLVQDDAAGISVTVPGDWRVQQDPVLFNTYGFALFDPSGPSMGGHERSPVARVALAYQAQPGQIEALVADLMSKYSEFPLTRSKVRVGPGLEGIAVSGLPGTDPYTLVYVADGDRVYRIGLWTEEPGLNPRAHALLAGLRFEPPRRSVQSLGLMPVEQARYAEPPPEQMALNRQAQRERALLTALEGGEPAEFAEPADVNALACESAQPTGMLWQTVWDYTNKFYSGYTTVYSGTYYNLRPGDPGWSAMSGNYGSWWGQNYHVRKCEPYLLNQFYANDWPAHKNANVYPAITGTVEWAGWDYQDAEGYYTLGNYVVVRNNGYRAIMAHLTSIAAGIGPGTSVGMNTIIGYAGKTGGPWDEHVHSRVAYGESKTYNGQPYGGNTVWPTRLRCVSCKATDPGDARGNGDGQFDLKDSSGAKFYTRFYHGRWMRG